MTPVELKNPACKQFHGNRAEMKELVLAEECKELPIISWQIAFSENLDSVAKGIYCIEELKFCQICKYGPNGQDSCLEAKKI